MVLALLAVLAAATPADAHATLLFTTPPVDGTVTDPPASISLLFDERVHPTADAVRLATDDGHPVSLAPAQLRHGGREVVADVTGAIRPGIHRVRWTVTATDGDVIAGQFRFAVGATGQSLTPTGGQTFTAGFGWTAALRWLLFAGYALALGALVGRWILRAVAERDGLALPRPHALAASVAAGVAAVGLAAVVAGDGNPIRGVTRPGALVDSGPGQLVLTEITALGLTVLALRRRRPGWAGALLAAVAVAEGVRGHPQAATRGWGAASVTVHLLAAAIWVGALVYTLRTAIAWRSHRAAVRAVFRSYARLAVWLFAVAVATGTINALLVVPLDSVLSTPYGLVLLSKLALVALAAGAALGSRLRLRTRSDPGPVTRIEAGVLAGVLAATAILTVVAPPTRAAPALPLPPPPAGTAVAVGSRAGMIGITATASTNQLVIRLTAPQPATRYRLTANHLTPGSTARPLRLRACGRGCYLATPTWRRGDNTVTVRATAAGWPGGTASLRIPWPIRPAPDTLRRTVTAMRSVRRLTVHERVTSDTSQGLGTPRAFHRSGAAFLDDAGEPYATGVAPTTALLTSTSKSTTLALGYPAENITVLLTIDDSSRIQREILTGPNHLVHRTFVYPDHAGGS